MRNVVEKIIYIEFFYSVRFRSGNAFTLCFPAWILLHDGKIVEKSEIVDLFRLSEVVYRVQAENNLTSTQ